MKSTDKATTSRLNVNLTRRATEELEELGDRTGLSKTDLINRSINLYRFITSRQLDGCTLLIRDKNGETLMVHVV